MDPRALACSALSVVTVVVHRRSDLVLDHSVRLSSRADDASADGGREGGDVLGAGVDEIMCV